MVKYFKLLIALIFLSAAVLSKEQEYCRILSLQGGGDKGAFQAGALKGLIDNLPSEDVEWDVVSGISVGSINAFAMSLLPKGQEKKAIDTIINMWLEIKGSHDIYQNWSYLGFFYGLLFKEGIYDTTPLRNLLHKASANYTKIQRDLSVGATSVNSGIYHRFSNMTIEDAIHGVMASAAYPGFFPPEKINGDSLTDGGISFSIDVTAAIDLCKQRGFPEEKVIIDSVFCHSNKIQWQKEFTSLTVISEALTLMMDEFRFRDIDQILRLYPNIKFRYMVEPTQPISSPIPLFFTPSEIRDMIKKGIKDAEDVIKKGEGIAFQQMLNNRYEDPKVKEGKFRNLK